MVGHESSVASRLHQLCRACRAEAGVEELHTFRGPLNMGLRVFEDIPELIIGLLDLASQL